MITYIILGLVFYLIGAILSYGRCLASFAAIDDKFIRLPPSEPSGICVVVGAMSWVGFAAGVMMYFTTDRIDLSARFLRYSMKDIWERHNNDPRAQEYKRLGLQ